MFSFEKEVYSYWQSFLRLIYPANCATCKIPLLLYESYLCSHCTLMIKPLKDPKCARCVRPLPPYGIARKMCTTCASHRPFYHRGFSLVPYESQVKTIFHEIKFQKKPWLLKVFLNLLSDFSGTAVRLSDYDLIVPVPLDWQKELERGFNQAESIAKMLQKQINYQIPIRQILKKKKTTPQSQLRRADRLVNLNGAFSIRKRANLKGSHVLIVDDIFTTGSTINECAKLLREHGAEQVDFFTIARS
jgi:ComF family protein